MGKPKRREILPGRGRRVKSNMIDLAIVGGGPGGLMAAWHLKKKLGDKCRVTIFEASDRVGGKVLTSRFTSSPAMYEAGVAEIYDYSMIGPDPLRDLIQHFGFQTIPMDAETVVLDGHVVPRGVVGMRRRFGDATADAIVAFRQRCTEVMSISSYYEGVGAQDNEHPWIDISFEELLEKEVNDPVAKRFFKAMARSDVASEPHLTNGLNALKNILMDVDGYIGVYSIQNGNEQLVQGLASEINADVQLNHRVLKVGRTDGGRYQLNMMNGKGPETRDFDLVMMCLPHNWLATMQWDGELLRRAMTKHVAYFDRPAHYLRVAALFDVPFWGDKLEGAWFMSESFGGCCVYIEGARHDVGRHGVLNWLIPGADALAFANLSDEALVETALKSLPAELGNAREYFIEAKVHRWLSSVNAIPGGVPVRDVMTNHRPEPKEHPGLVLVGDYLFDSTLNGLLDSSDAATDIVVSEVTRLHYERAGNPQAGRIDRGYFENYRKTGASYARSWKTFSDPDYLVDLVKIVWGRSPPYRMLVAGSASGELVGALRERGIDAWGVEANRFIHGQTPEAIKPYNLHGTILDLPFKDSEFDFVFETSLCHVSDRSTSRAIRELHRVVGAGLIFGSVTSDLTFEIVDRYDLMRGVKRLGTWWEWSELFFNAGFDLAMSRADTLGEVWQCVLAAGKGPGRWYDDAECLRYSFFDKTTDE